MEPDATEPFAGAPAPGTIERWAWDYVTSTHLEDKLAPPAPPAIWASCAEPRRLRAPGRPRALDVVRRAPKSPGPEAIRTPVKRAQLVHTFLHHELQAAELMAWALLAFPDTPRAFRRGLVAILLDEVRHMHLYRMQLGELGFTIGDFAVRDWFWERVPRARTAAEFLAVLGIGFEGGNLDHARRFAERFRAIGDARGAAVQEQVGDEEVRHVRFAVRWFARFAGSADFATWSAHLPPPLSPLVMRGEPLNRGHRLRSGLSPRFVDELSAWQGRPSGS